MDHLLSNFIYQIILTFLLILSPIIIFLRILKNKEDKKRFIEKFGFIKEKRTKGNLVWIHVASVGELMSVLPLIHELEKIKYINLGSKLSGAVVTITDKEKIDLARKD